MREASLEATFRRRVRASGGEVRKLVTPGRRHAPDRMVIVPCCGADGKAEIVFVELKKPGEKPRPGQEREHERLRRWGCNVEVIDSHEGIQRFLEIYL